MLPKWWAVFSGLLAIVLLIGPIGWIGLIFGIPIWTIGTTLILTPAPRPRPSAPRRSRSPPREARSARGSRSSRPAPYSPAAIASTSCSWSHER